MSFSAWASHYGYAAPTGTVGTRIAAGTALTGIPVLERPSVDEGITYSDVVAGRDFPTLGSGDVWLLTKVPRMQLQFMANAFILADMFYGLYQKVISEGLTPFKKVFEPSASSLKSIQIGDAIGTDELPHVIDVIRRNQNEASADKDEHLISAIPTQIVLTGGTGDSQLVTATVDLLGFDSDIKGVDHTGTITHLTGSQLGKKFIPRLYFKVGGTAIPVQSWTLTVPNGLESHPYNLGTPQGMHLGIFGVQLQLQLPMDTAKARGLFGNYDPTATPFVTTGAPFQGAQVTVLAYGPRPDADTVDAESNVVFTIRGFVTQLTGGGGLGDQLTQITIMGVYDGTNAPLTAAIVDNTDRLWI